MHPSYVSLDKLGLTLAPAQAAGQDATLLSLAPASLAGTFMLASTGAVLPVTAATLAAEPDATLVTGAVCPSACAPDSLCS